MHGLQSRRSKSELGYPQRSGHPNIAKLAAVVGATVFGGQAVGAVDTGNTDRNHGATAVASAVIVRPFELKVPEQGHERQNAKNNGSSSMLIFDSTESIHDCVMLLSKDVKAVRTDLCKLYLIELH